jgi:hypothetical protein
MSEGRCLFLNLVDLKDEEKNNDNKTINIPLYVFLLVLPKCVMVYGESIATSSNTFISAITIVDRADVYTKDLYPLYVQNINSVNRSNTQTESFKLIVKV